MALLVSLTVCGVASAQGNREKSREALAHEVQSLPVFPGKLVWIGKSTPLVRETQALLVAINRYNDGGTDEMIESLYRYTLQHSDSGWTPSLQANLGRYYRTHGRYSRALELWEAAWRTTGAAAEGDAKDVGDFTLVHWTRLLASLGRTEKLEELFSEADGRAIDTGGLQQKFTGTKEGFNRMSSDLGRQSSFRCGTYALMHVANQIDPEFDFSPLLGIASPVTGFNMAQLKGFSDDYHLGLVPVRRVSGDRIPVPSVVHWKLDHYAAITEKVGEDLYRVVDPTFEMAWTLKGEVILEESSGNFMVLEEDIAEGFRRLEPEETATVYGKGAPNNVNDGDAEGCETPEDADEIEGDESAPINQVMAPNPNQDGDDCDSCGEGFGMPSWKVIEPYVTLEVTDKPLYYTTSYGKRNALTLTYLHRNTREDTGNRAPSFGMNWESNWLSYLEVEDPENPEVVRMNVAQGGGRVYDAVNETPHMHSETKMYAAPSSTTGMSVSSRNGAVNNFTWSKGFMSGPTHFFLTSRVSRTGVTHLDFNYADATTWTKLDSITDVDGKTIQFYYTNTALPNHVTSVKDPYNRYAHFFYDSLGRLTNIVDAESLSTAFQYDSNHSLTNMVTPYGATSFEYYDMSYSGYDLGGMAVNRAIFVTEPDGKEHLYAYRDNSEYLDDSAEAEELISPRLPIDLVPDVVTNSSSLYLPFENLEWDNETAWDWMYGRNSFYWGPLQFAELTGTFQTGHDFDHLEVEDYLYARMRHYLHPADDYTLLGRLLSVERAFSPDGSAEGIRTFYDYPGKQAYGGDDASLFEGTSPKPSIIARKLEDGDTAAAVYLQNEKNSPTNVITTYTGGSGTAWRTNTLVYNADDITLKAVFGPEGDLVAGYSYTTNNLVSTYTNALSEVTKYFYDNTTWKLTGIVYPNGLQTTNFYYTSGDFDGFLQKRIHVGWQTNTFTYGDGGWVEMQTDALGHTVTNSWDDLQRLVTRETVDGTTTISYDKLLPESIIDPMGYTNRFEFTAGRQLAFHYDARGNTNSYEYCDCGSLESMTDPLGNETEYLYDTAGRLTDVIYPAEGATQLSVSRFYGLSGRLTNVVESTGYSITNEYNNQGLLTSVKNAAGQLLSTTYDIQNRPTSIVTADGVTINQTFDDAGRLLSQGRAGGGTVHYGYTANIVGPTASTNELGHYTLYFYDALGRRTNEVFYTSTGTATHTNKYVYDAAGNLKQLVDAKNQSTYWNYDLLSRVTQKKDHLHNVNFTYGYNANGWLTSRITPLNTTAYSYDADGNLTDVDYSGSTYDITYSYDAASQLTNMVDAVGTTKFAYTGFGALKSEDGPWADDTVSYGYNDSLLRETLDLLQPSGAWGLDYAYDAANRMTNIVSELGAFGYIYDTTAKSRVKKRTLPSSSYVTNSFDSLARLQSTALKDSGNTTLNSHAYVYNNGNQRTKQTFTDGNYVDYLYDNVGQLYSAKGKESGGTTRSHEQFGYKYDTAGNLNTRTNNAFRQTFTVNGLNQPTSLTRSGSFTVSGTTGAAATEVKINTTLTATLYSDDTFAKTGISLSNGDNTFTAIASDSLGRSATNSITVNLPSSVTPAFDSNGNLSNDDRRYFTYTPENELETVYVSGNWKTEFEYDGFGRKRVQKEYLWVSSAWALQSEKRYVYDGMLAIQERDGSNLPTATYMRGLDIHETLEGGGGLASFLARKDHGNGVIPTVYYNSDGAGNVAVLANDAEAVVGQYHYDPYGNLITAAGQVALDNPYRFSSKEFHNTSGLYYYGYRFYDPNIQRWINRDPFQENGGINLYGFVGGDPQNIYDSDGRFLGFVASAVAIGVGVYVVVDFAIGLYDGYLNTQKHNMGAGEQLNRLMDANPEDIDPNALQRARMASVCIALDTGLNLPLHTPGTTLTGPVGGPTPGVGKVIPTSTLTGRPGYRRVGGYVKNGGNTYVPPYYRRPPGSDLLPPNNDLYPR